MAINGNLRTIIVLVGVVLTIGAFYGLTRYRIEKLEEVVPIVQDNKETNIVQDGDIVRCRSDILEIKKSVKESNRMLGEVLVILNRSEPDE